jgi:protein-S-isoprenylcysteine O-methyltransferase Ste14
MPQLALSLMVFYALHSVLAWTGVKRWAATSLGLDRWYRLTYTLVSLGLSAWVLIAYGAIPTGGVLFPSTPLLTVAGWSLMVGGGVLAGAAVLRFGGAGFLGFRPERSTGLVRTGMHGRMRHPIYTGIILSALGWLLLGCTPEKLVVVGITFVYLPIGIHLEERKLITAFGEEYLRYRREVPALIPRWHTT